MSNTGSSIKDEVIREIDSGTLTTSYQVFGAVFTRDCFRIWITNNTNGDIYLSTDGINNIKKLKIHLNGNELHITKNIDIDHPRVAFNS